MRADDVVILGGARTAMAEYVGAFKDLSAIELGAQAARAALERSGVQAGQVDHYVMGNALQTSADAIYEYVDRWLPAKATAPDGVSRIH